jgi:hypothetical protein
VSGMGGPYGDGRGPLTRTEALAAATALSDTESAYVLRYVAALAPGAVGAAISELRTYEAEHGPPVPGRRPGGAPARDGESVTVSLPHGVAGQLSVLAGTPDRGAGAVADVLGRLIDHAQQGVTRPGSWERSWVCQVFGHDWIFGG